MSWHINYYLFTKEYLTISNIYRYTFTLASLTFGFFCDAIWMLFSFSHNRSISILAMTTQSNLTWDWPIKYLQFFVTNFDYIYINFFLLISVVEHLDPFLSYMDSILISINLYFILILIFLWWFFSFSNVIIHFERFCNSILDPSIHLIRSSLGVCIYNSWGYLFISHNKCQIHVPESLQSVNPFNFCYTLCSIFIL